MLDSIKLEQKFIRILMDLPLLDNPNLKRNITLIVI